MFRRSPISRSHFAFLLLGLALCTPLPLHAATVVVNVGPGGTLTFNPANVTINVTTALPIRLKLSASNRQIISMSLCIREIRSPVA